MPAVPSEAPSTQAPSPEEPSTETPSAEAARRGRPRVLITGGASGIGAAVVARCREDGYETVILDRDDSGEGTIQCDLADPEATAAALQRALAGGPITRLVNNVGVVMPNLVSDQTLDEFDRVIALNMRSALQCAQALLPGMREAGFGRIVGISSRALLGKPLRSAYAASKAGMVGMSRVWALEEGAAGITSNTVAPGPIATELFAQANPEGAPSTQQLLREIPVNRVGTPEDVAHAVSYFLDDRSGFVTGQTMFVCGGVTVGRAGV